MHEPDLEQLNVDCLFIFVLFFVPLYILYTEVVAAAAVVDAVAGSRGSCDTCGGAGVDVPRLLEPRVAAHIERGRIAMRKLEEMFAKHPTLQSQEVKVLSLLRWLRSPSADVAQAGAGGARGGDVPRLLQPPVAALVQRLYHQLRQLLALFHREPARETHEVRGRPASPRTDAAKVSFSCLIILQRACNVAQILTSPVLSGSGDRKDASACRRRDVSARVSARWWHNSELEFLVIYYSDLSCCFYAMLDISNHFKCIIFMCTIIQLGSGIM